MKIMNRNFMNRNTILLFALLLISSFILTGCTKYVCYTGSVERKSENCPILQVYSVSEDSAGRYVDNYGLAVAQAKRQTYTRVNMYNKNATWYANVLFTDSSTGGINNVLLRIDGNTGDVSCTTGCEYFTPLAPTETVVDTQTTG